MKFNCGETFTEKKQLLKQWHRWFAWRPVKLDDHDCRWFEWVARRGFYVTSWDDDWWDWEFRELPPRYRK